MICLKVERSDLVGKKINIFLLTTLLLLIVITPSYGHENYDIIKLKDGISPYGNHAFNDGLIPIMYKGSISENGNWAYLTEDGNVFSHKYASGFEYSEGLTPIIKETIKDGERILKLGYMNRRGKTVIEPQFDVYSKDGVTYGGRFLNGQALVFKYDESKKEGHSIPGYWHKIDRDGKVIDENEIVETKDLIFDGNDKDLRIYNDMYSSNYESEEDLTLYGKKISKVRFNYDKALVSIGDGDNKGSYIVSKAIVEEKNPLAKKSNQTILLDGEKIDIDAYLINGNNYFKLRDIAYLLNGTDKQFNVLWNKNTKEIDIRSNTSYTKVGGEMTKSPIKEIKTALSKSPIYLNGERVYLRAYKIDNNNYFKLRNIGKSLDISVVWDEKTQTVSINTKEGYME